MRPVVAAALAFSALVLIAAPAAAAPADIAARVDPAAALCPGALSFYARNLDTGVEYAHRPDERVRTASTIKLAVMAATFAFVERGEASWSETIELKDVDKVGGSGVLREFSEGVRLPLRDIVHMMIVVSDNTATNMILERFTADAINDYSAAHGMKVTRVLHKALQGDNKNPSKRGISREDAELGPTYGMGVSSPREMVELMAAMERGELVSPTASKEMNAILRREQDRTGIGRRDRTPNASKYGSLERLRADVGVVYTPGGRVAMAITDDSLPEGTFGPDNPGSLCVATVSEALTAALSAKP
jgi:beta-lactamase class A